MKIINPEGVEWCDVGGAGDSTLSGLMKFCGTVTQGSPALRATPGLSDGIPLGFKTQPVCRRAFHFGARTQSVRLGLHITQLATVLCLR
jgi:hypothetical protein